MSAVPIKTDLNPPSGTQLKRVALKWYVSEVAHILGIANEAASWKLAILDLVKVPRIVNVA